MTSTKPSKKIAKLESQTRPVFYTYVHVPSLIPLGAVSVISDGVESAFDKVVDGEKRHKRLGFITSNVGKKGRRVFATSSPFKMQNILQMVGLWNAQTRETVAMMPSSSAYKHVDHTAVLGLQPMLMSPTKLARLIETREVIPRSDPDLTKECNAVLITPYPVLSRSITLLDTPSRVDEEVTKILKGKYMRAVAAAFSLPAGMVRSVVQSAQHQQTQQRDEDMGHNDTSNDEAEHLARASEEEERMTEVLGKGGYAPSVNATNNEATPARTPEHRVKPSDFQVGGNHYKNFKIQPGEFAEANGLSFFEGDIVKRLCRHSRGGKGIEDLRKCAHEIELIAEFQYGVDLTANEPSK